MGLATVDDFLQHAHNHLSGDDPITLYHLVHFLPDLRFSLILVSDKAVDVQVSESMLLGQLFCDFLAQVVAVSARPNVHDTRLYVFEDVVESFFF